MIFRRSEEGAVKCALRDLRLLLDTEVEYFILRSLVTASFRKAEARAFLRLLFSAGPRRAVQFSYGAAVCVFGLDPYAFAVRTTYKVVYCTALLAVVNSGRPVGEC